jgi:cbb3-type cytochrome oxidase subunit 3
VKSLLLLLVFIALIAFLVWQARREKARHDAVSYERPKKKEDKDGDGDLFDADYD